MRGANTGNHIDLRRLSIVMSGGAAHPLCTGCAQGYGATGGGHDRTVLGVPTMVLVAFPITYLVPLTGCVTNRRKKVKEGTQKQQIMNIF